MGNLQQITVDFGRDPDHVSLLVHQDRLFQACFPTFSTVCLELAATNSSHQRLHVCF